MIDSLGVALLYQRCPVMLALVNTGVRQGPDGVTLVRSPHPPLNAECGVLESETVWRQKYRPLRVQPQPRANRKPHEC